MRTVSLATARNFFPRRDRDSHKGQNGRVLVIGGSRDYTGAPALAALSAIAALRSGVDLVTVASLEKPGWVISTYSPDIIVRKLAGEKWSNRHLAKLVALSRKADAVLVGNGMGREKTTTALVRSLVRKCNAKMVLDADALHACAGMKFARQAIITPHQAEFEAFSGIRVEGKGLGEKVLSAKKVAERHHCTVLLKGRVDIITDGKSVFLNRTGNARMTVGGTGDTLAGVCSAFLALKAEPVNAAAAAAFVNGKAGSALFKGHGYTFVASDMIGAIAREAGKLLR